MYGEFDAEAPQRSTSDSLDIRMANLKSIKSKILSYKKTGTVTHAMEAVSAVKMRKAQQRAIAARP